ncbi:MAG: efflux RND transporter periplasmic adaptor subunit [Bacteroidia bacterium]|nr:efflux RND transporter periplasmic adaptor subunit [Bacteroidia bacterium]
MKKVLLSLGVIVVMFGACKNNGDKKSQLETIKKQMADLKTQADKLEAEIALTDTSKTEGKVKMVSVTSLTKQVFTNYIQVQGKVDADENVTINPEIPGVITKVNVKVGDEISHGQVLAELDSKVMQQVIIELKTALDLANTMYEKQKNLWDQKIGTEVQYLSAKNQKESLEKKMATMQQQLEMAHIKSPIDGTVDEVYVKLGQTAAPGFPAVRVVNFSNLKVKAEVPENYAAKVKKGNNSIVLFPDINDTVAAPISFSAKVINSLNRTFNVEVALDNNKDYRPNMIAVVKIIDYVNKEAIAIPVGTVQHAEDGDFVFIETGGKAKKIKVTLGHEYNGTAEIISGLKEGDKLITTGYQDLNEGEAIRY